MYWSSLARRALPLGLGYRSGKLRECHYAPAAIVIHTTGRGPIERATADKFEAWRRRCDVADGDALHAAVTLYTRVMDASGHYVIGQDGTIVQLVPESHAAWHVGGAGSRPYFNAPTTWWHATKCGWWRERWPDCDSPRDLAGGKLWREPYTTASLAHRIKSGFALGTCNENTIGIEVVGSGPWSAEAWHALAALVVDIGQRRGLELRRDTVISHSDAHPLTRTTHGGRPWDPSDLTWSWDRMQRVLADVIAPRVVA